MASYFIELPLVSGGGGAVDSVNGQTGVVVLTAADVDLHRKRRRPLLLRRMTLHPTPTRCLTRSVS
jgi:hypothetical protein